MGDAKRRKAKDQTFGRIGKADVERGRGILLSPPLRIDGDAISLSSGLDPQELRYALLFWDRLAVSTNRFIQIEIGDDAEFLQRLGVIEKVPVHITSLFPGSYQELHLPAFRQLDQNAPGVWSLSSNERSFQWLGMPEGAADNTVVELIRAIPVPDQCAALEDILDFKRKRSDELKRLMAEIDAISTTVRNAECPSTALAQQKLNIEQSCIDLFRTAKEYKLPVRLADVKCSFEFSAPKSLFTAGVADAVFGMPLLGSTIACALSSIKVTGEFKRQSVRDRSSPYQYVHDVHERLF